MIKWTCHVCGELRPDHRISVYKIDRSLEFNLPIGTMIHNVRYCNDRQLCLNRAREVKLNGGK